MTVTFTPNIQRHVSCPATQVEGKTVRQVLDAVFEGNPQFGVELQPIEKPEEDHPAWRRVAIFEGQLVERIAIGLEFLKVGLNEIDM